MFGGLLRAVYRDHTAQEAVVRASGLDWTIARPAALKDGPAQGKYRVGFRPDERNITSTIARADVAAFMLETAASGSHFHVAVVLSD